MKNKFLSIIIIALISLSTFAQDINRTHDITIEDYFTQKHIDKCAASPDGKLAAFNVLEWDKIIDGRNSNIFVVNLQTKDITQVTSAIENGTDTAMQKMYSQRSNLFGWSLQQR